MMMKSMFVRLSFLAVSCSALMITSCKKDDDPFGAGVIEICDKQETELRLKNHKSGVDYLITCDLEVISGKLIVEAGVTVAVSPDKTIRVYSDGAIVVEGTSSEPVTFQPSESSAGASWGGIVVSNNNAANNLSNLVIDRAGAVNLDYDMSFNVPFPIEAGLAINGRCSVNGISVQRSGGVGVYVSPQSNLVQFSNITVNNSGGYAIAVPSGLVKSIQAGNSFSGNTPNKIYVWGESIEDSHVWNAAGIPYLLANDLNLYDASLEIMQGAVLEVETDKGIYVPSGSSLKVTGTVASPVIIRGKENFAGWWKGIIYESNSPLNVWTNVDLSNGGSTSMTNFGAGTKATLYLGGLFQASTRWTGTNVHIHDGDGCGILREGAQVTYEGNNVTFSSTDSDICDE